MRRGNAWFLACAVVAAACSCVAAKTAGKPDFAKIDTNKNGKIETAEFNAYIAAYPELGLTKATFSEWDVNKDGTVTHQEFEAWVPMEKGTKKAGEKK